MYEEACMNTCAFLIFSIIWHQRTHTFQKFPLCLCILHSSFPALILPIAKYGILTCLDTVYSFIHAFNGFVVDMPQKVIIAVVYK